MKKLMKKYKRGLAGFLACCMLMTSVNTAAWAAEGMGTAADPGREILMHLDREQLQEAALDAIIEGSDDETKKITPETLSLLSLEEDGAAKKYQKLFSENEDGDFYEVFPEFEEDDRIPEYASLRMFIRANASEDYKLTGKEEVVLLFSNGSAEKVSFRVWIDDNYLPAVSVKANSKESVDAEETLPGTTEESTEGAADESESAAPDESEAESEDGTEAETEEPKDAENDETGAAESDEAPEKDETVAAEKDEAEDDNDRTEGNGAADEPQISISSRKVPVVTRSGSADDDEEYFEDVDLIDDINGEIPEDTGTAGGTQEIKPVKLEGKLLDEIILTTGDDAEAGSIAARAFVTTIDELLVEGKPESIQKATGSNATLLVKHAHVSEGDEYYYLEEVITDLKSGTVVNGVDYDPKDVLFPLVKSEPEQLALTAGDNEITLYYGIDKEAMKQRIQSWETPARSRFRSAEIALDPGRVEARKTSVWTDQAEGKAKISLSVEGEPVRRPIDVVLVLDASGSMWQRAGLLGNGEYRLDMAVKAANRFMEELFKENQKVSGIASKNRLGVVLFGGTPHVQNESEFGSTFGNVTGSQNPQLLSSAGEKFETIQGWKKVNLTLGDVFQAYSDIRETTYPSGLSTYFQSGLLPAAKMVERYRDPNRDLYVIMMSDGDASELDAAGYKESAEKIKEHATLYTMGLALEDGNSAGIEKLKELATDDLYINVENAYDLEEVFEKLARDLKYAGTNAVMQDTLSADFEIDPDWTPPAGIIIKEVDGRTVIEWSIGNITKEAKILDIPVRVKDGAALEPGETTTNDDVHLTYTDVDGNPAEKKEGDIGRPTLTVGGGSINVKYYLVNEEGKFLDKDGAILEGDRENFKHIVSEAYHKDEDENHLLTLGKDYSITPQTQIVAGGVTYILYGSTDPVTVRPTNNNPGIDVVFKVYKDNTNFKLTYMDGETVLGEPESYKDGVDVTVRQAPEGKDGYNFAGWKVEGSGTVYAPADIFRMPKGDVVLQAVWVQKTVVSFEQIDLEKVYDGDALTLSKDAYKPDGLEPGHSVVITFKEGTAPSITDAGDKELYGSEVVIKIVDGTGKDVTDKYTVHPPTGKMSVKQRPITFQASSGEKKYDQTALRLEDIDPAYTITSSDKLVKEHQVASVTKTGSQTVIGWSASAVSNAVIQTKDGTTDVSANYAITYLPGKLEIVSNPQSIHITYQYKSGDEGDMSELPAPVREQKEFGESYEYITGEIPGYMADTAVISGTATENVTATVTYYKVKGKDYNVTYKGDAYSFDMSVVTGYIPGSTLTCSTTENGVFGEELPTFTDVKMDADGNVIPYTVYVKATKDGVSATVAVNVTVQQKPVTIAARKTGKVYDGITIYANENWSISSGTLVEGHTPVITEWSGEATNVTSEDVEALITKALVKHGELDVTHNYKLSYEKGWMKITKASNIVLEANNIEKVYDGEVSEIIPKLYVVDEAGNRTEYTGEVAYTYEVNKHRWSSSELKFSEAATYQVHITAETENYETRSYDCEAIIKKRPLTIQAGSATKQFNSETTIPFVEHSFTNTPHGNDVGLIAKHEIVDVTYSGELLGIGKTENKITAFDIRTAGENPISVKGNYDWKTVEGQLVLSKGAQLGITGESINIPYDGKGHSLNLTITGGTGTLMYAESPDGPWLEAIEEKVDAGTYNIYGKAVSADYEDSEVRTFTITINKLIAAYTANSASKIYDGIPLTDGGHVTTPVGFEVAEGDELEITVTGSAIDVTDSRGKPNTITSFAIYHTYPDGRREDVSERNYDITLNPGTLVITAAGGNEVSVSDITGTYHGEGWTFADPTAIEGSEFLYSDDNGASWTSVKPSYINANEDGYKILVKATHKNYADTAVKTVTITIKKRPIQITANSASKPYDATELKNNGFEVTELESVAEQGLAKNDKIDSVTVTGSITVVGSAANVASNAKIINQVKEDVTDNYDLKYVDGLLKIDANNYTLTIQYLDKDGKEVRPSYTKAGYNYNEPYEIETPKVPGYVADIAVVSGNMPKNSHTVTVRLHKPEADSINTEFDGNAHGVQASDIKDYPAGSKIEFGSSLDGPWSEEAPAYTDANRKDNVSNGNPDKIYVKVSKDGQETVITVDVVIRQRPVTIQATVAERMFTPGIHITAITNPKITGSGLVGGHEIDETGYSWKGEARAVTPEGGIETVIESAKIVKGKVDQTDNYKITLLPGNIRITAAGGNVVNVTGITGIYNGDEWTFADPTAIEGSEFWYSTDNGASWTKDKPSYTHANGSGYESGYESGNENSYHVQVKATHPNYSETDPKDVEIIIGKRPVQITAEDAFKAYDGEPLTEKGWKITALPNAAIQGLAKDDKIGSVTVTGTIIKVGSEKNAASDATFKTSAGKDITNNYAPSYVDGTLEITANNYTLTVEYVDTDGVKAADSSVTTGLNYDDAYTIKTPQIEGYVADIAVVSGNMPKGDRKIKVTFYKPTADGIDITYDGKSHEIGRDEVEGYPAGSEITFATSPDGPWSNVPPTFSDANRKDNKPNGNPDKVYVKVTRDGQEAVIEVDVVIKQKPITIQATIKTQTYVPDMKLTAISHADITNPDPIAGHEIKYTRWIGEATGVTAAGGVKTEILEVIISEGETDKTANYDITLLPGKLIVTAAGGNQVTVIDKEGTYNGDEWTFHDPAAMEGSEFWYSADGGETWTKEKPTYTDAKEDGYKVLVKAEHPNYETETPVEVTITIRKRPIQITAETKSRPYDAEPLTGSYKVTMMDGETIQGLAKDDKIASVTVTGTITDIGSTDNVASAAKFVNAAGKDVTGNYAPRYVDGTLTITANNYTLTVEYVDTKGNRLADSDVTTALNYMDTYSVPTPKVKGYVADMAVVNGNMPKGNHNVTVTFYKPSAEGVTVVYDGAAHGITKDQVTGYPEGSTIEFSTSENGDWSATAPAFTEANRKQGNSNGNPDKVYVRITRDGQETIIEVSIVIRQKPVTIQATVAEQMFEPGMSITAITNPTVTNPDPITGHEIVYGDEGEGWTGKATGATSGDGITTVIHKVTMMDGDVDRTGNYEITLLPGKLKVNPSNANAVKVKDITGMFDGSQWTIEDPTAVAGSEFWYSTDGGETWSTDKPSYTEANEDGYKVLVKAEHPDYLPTDPVEVTITINRRPITIKADDAEKPFDNEPLTMDSATISEGVLADGHELAKVILTGSITEVGFAKNTASNAEIVFDNPKARSKTDVTDNYKITYVNGVLEVTDNPHNLDITYQYHAGEEGSPELLPEDYSRVLRFQDNYSVVTKEIFGYVADWKVVEGTMRLEDIKVTVTYHKDENGNGLPDGDEDKHTITFKAGDYGTLEGAVEFKDILTGTEFGKAVAVPVPKANRGYSFVGWQDVSDTSKGLPEETSLVTASKEYEAVWKRTGGGGGGGGSTGGGSTGGGNTGGGPGTPNETTTIIPEEPPLASLPPVAPDGNDLMIDDGEVPLAALPKTGDRGAGTQLAIMFSALFAGLFIALSKKKEEEQ